MKYSYKLSDAVHILTYIEIAPTVALDSVTIAASVEANPSVVRRLMASLKKAGLLVSRAGAAKPHLARPASEINLLDIFKAVEVNNALLHVDPKTNMACPVGAHIQQTLDQAYDRVQRAAEAEMGQLTLQMMIDDLRQRQTATLKV